MKSRSGLLFSLHWRTGIFWPSGLIFGSCDVNWPFCPQAKGLLGSREEIRLPLLVDRITDSVITLVTGLLTLACQAQIYICVQFLGPPVNNPTLFIFMIMILVLLQRSFKTAPMVDEQGKSPREYFTIG